MNDLFKHVKCGDATKLAKETKFLEGRLNTLGEDCRALGPEGNKPFCYRRCVGLCATALYHYHFGFRCDHSPACVAGKGIEMALTYFGVVSDVLAEMTSETDRGKGTAWLQPYSHALLFCTLVNRARERTQLSDFLHPRLVSGTIGAAVEIDPAVGDVVLCMAASFQSLPMETAPLLERLGKSRKHRPKLLFRAWQMLQSDDIGGFASALADSTSNFAKTTADDSEPLTAVAVAESILAALAYERGWTDLSFELPIAARLVTHESLELK